MGVLAAQPSKIWLIAGLAGAFMTAYYSARLIFIILFPKELEKVHHDPAKHMHIEKTDAIEVDHDPGHSHAAQGHEAGHGPHLFWLMAVPCIILASVTLVLGFCEAPLEAFLTGVHEVAEHGAHAAHEAAHGGLGHYVVMILAIGCALSGIGLAWKEFGKGSSKVGFLTKFPAVEKLFASRWYMDDFFRWFLDRVIYGGFTSAFTRNDRRVIDGAIDGVCKFTIDGGRVFSFLQSGMLQYNLLIMVGVVGVVILYFIVG